MSQAGNNKLAHELLQLAYKRSYHLSEEFQGFRASIQLSDDQKTHIGSLIAISPQDTRISMTVDQNELEWIQHEITSLYVNIWNVPYKQGDGRYKLRLLLDEQHPLGYLIQFTDDPHKTSYRLKDGLITRINRCIGDTRYSVFFQDYTFTEQGQALPSHYTVVFWDAVENYQVRTDIYYDQWISVQNIYLPKRRLVTITTDDGAAIRSIELSRHELITSKIESQQKQQTSSI